MERCFAGISLVTAVYSSCRDCPSLGFLASSSVEKRRYTRQVSRHCDITFLFDDCHQNLRTAFRSEMKIAQKNVQYELEKKKQENSSSVKIESDTLK